MSAKTSIKGEAPSIVESFRIEGLHGYRNISLSSDYAATILIARNGSGKTTLLAALDAFLKGQFSRLRDLKFALIGCKLRGVQNELVLTPIDIKQYVTFPPEFELEARRLETDPKELFNFIEEWDRRVQVPDDRVFAAILRRSDYSRANALAYADNLQTNYLANSPRIASIRQSLKLALADAEIVYLPTYRRIELSIEPERDPHGRLIKRFKKAQFGLQTGDIQFGVADILERLGELNQRIVLDSNEGYRQISASIINELIDGTFERGDSASSEIPDRIELELFFTRLLEGRRMRPYLDVSLPNLDKIYSGSDISWESNKFLRYFLAKLNVVINTTRGIETLVGDFIDRCNDYLAGPQDFKKETVDGNDEDKVLKLNRQNLKVFVESVPAGRVIPVDALSSGEKQIVSLFARLYLYPRRKIVLIDEPELSLSLDWQQRILVDVINAPLCNQVVAITHSPFIFDNELEAYARPLSTSVQQFADESLITDELADDAGRE
jgi:ABC-type lipoprotein export system ATPase subunit